MDHQDIAASLVHAAKNRLQLLQPRFDALMQHDDEAVRHSGEAISYQIEEVNRQLVLMLSLYRLEGDAKLNVESLYVQDELEICRDLTSDQRVSIECQSNLEVYADRRLLQAVLGDALHNALRYCRTSVRLQAETQNSGVVIRMLDDGPKQTVEAADGQGIGLLVANKIAEAHVNHGCKGHAGHRFDPELGSCFELYLP